MAVILTTALLSSIGSIASVTANQGSSANNKEHGSSTVGNLIFGLLIPLQQAYGQTSGSLEMQVTCSVNPSNNQLTCLGQVSEEATITAITSAQVQEGCQVPGPSGTVLPKSVTTKMYTIANPTIFTTEPDGSFVYHAGVVPTIQCKGAAEPTIISISYSGSITARSLSDPSQTATFTISA
jgi:hypothetical protein